MDHRASGPPAPTEPRPVMTDRPAQTRLLSVVTATALLAGIASADEVGYEALVARLGAATPTGAGVRVVQVEASEASGQQKISPNRTLAEFVGKSFYEQSGATTTSGPARLTFVRVGIVVSLSRHSFTMIVPTIPTCSVPWMEQ